MARLAAARLSVRPSGRDPRLQHTVSPGPEEPRHCNTAVTDAAPPLVHPQRPGVPRGSCELLLYSQPPRWAAHPAVTETRPLPPGGSCLGRSGLCPPSQVNLHQAPCRGLPPPQPTPRGVASWRPAGATEGDPASKSKEFKGVGMSPGGRVPLGAIHSPANNKEKEENAAPLQACILGEATRVLPFCTASLP